MNPSPASTHPKSDFLDSIQKGLLLGAAVLALVLPPASMNGRKPSHPSRMASGEAPLRHADSGAVAPTEDVRQLANWVAYVGNNQNKPFVILDKKDARVYVFERDGRLKAATPALLGFAVGDDNAPGIGSRPIADVRPEERT